MRYQLNQVIFGINFSLDVLRPDGMYHQPYLISDAAVKKVNFIRLTVAEHHKVHNEHDKEDAPAECDGYLLKNDDGVVFANQYPRASYSQTSNEGDYRFFRYIVTEEEYKEIVQKEPNVIFEYATVKQVLEVIMRGIKDLGDFKITENEASKRRVRELRQKLMDLYGRIVDEFNQTYPDYCIEGEYKQLVVGSDLRHFRVSVKKCFTPEQAKLLTQDEIKALLESENEILVRYPNGNIFKVVRGVEVMGATAYLLSYVKKLDPANAEKNDAQVVFFPVVPLDIVSQTFRIAVMSDEPEEVCKADTLNEVVETLLPEEEKQ